jgi:hypothetical protein
VRWRNNVLAIAGKALGPDHPVVATSLNDPTALYYRQSHYADADLLSKRTLRYRSTNWLRSTTAKVATPTRH